MDVDYNSQSEDEEYMYSDDDGSVASGEEANLSDEVETASDDGGGVKTGQKRKSRGRSSSVNDHAMRDNGKGEV